MRTVQISTPRFTKKFRTIRNRSLKVADRGQVLGTWTPAPAQSVLVDFEKRARQYSAAKMPVSFATLLRQATTPIKTILRELWTNSNKSLGVKNRIRVEHWTCSG